MCALLSIDPVLLLSRDILRSKRLIIIIYIINKSPALLVFSVICYIWVVEKFVVQITIILYLNVTYLWAVYVRKGLS
jgi:hypothetical protein